MGWSELLATAFAAGKPARGSQVFQIFENIKALASGSDPLSPKIKDLALVQAEPGDAYVFNNDNFLDLNFGYNYLNTPPHYSTTRTFFIQRGGVYKVTINADTQNYNGNSSNYRIYRNGLAYGELHTTGVDETAIISWVENLQFFAGDLVELRGYVDEDQIAYNQAKVLFSSSVFVPGTRITTS